MRFVLVLSFAPAALLAQADTATARRDTTQQLETVTVRAIRAGGEAPIAQKTLTADEIDRRSVGQDVPLLLQGSPSITAHSETGSQWGYSYLRMRGIDQSRINLTLDGIPLNDPEDQNLYFADFPDLANSVHSIQMQRGVGTSAPGTASYGGSINFQTVPLAATPRGGDLQLQGGSFGSLRASAEYATGVTASGLSLYSRVSAIRSGGYRDHSGMEGRSGFLSAAYLRERDMLKLTLLAGLFADTMAYVGATRAELDANRRFNPLRQDEVDRFGEQVAALSYTRQLTDASSASATVYRLSASGNYNCSSQCLFAEGDLWNYNLDFEWYGATAAWEAERSGVRTTAGVNANTYARDHFVHERLSGQPQTLVYLNTGHKDDASGFVKVAWDVGRMTLFGDVQGRWAEFRYTPDAGAGISTPAPISWKFLNPKVGATMHLAPAVDAFASFGMNAREPARSDMLAGLDNLDASSVDSVGPFSRVRPERVRDFEAGVKYEGRVAEITANAFAMEFRNEILPVGILIQGYTPLRVNVPSSWRRGVELDATVRPRAGIRLGANATLMRGQIARYTDEETSQTYTDVEPLLTPRFLTAQRVAVDVARGVTVELAGRYQSRSFLNNTGDPSLVLPSSYVADMAAHWSVRDHVLSLHVNNLTDSDGFAGGHVAFGEARYYVIPPLNVHLVMRLGW